LGFFSAPAQDEASEKHERASGYGGDGRDGDNYSSGERPWGSAAAEYIYRTESGEPYLRIVRTSAKQFPQFHWADGPQG
jgi:hypothetical protein